MKKFIIIVCCIVFLGACVLFERTLQKEENQQKETLQAIQNQINDLNQEKRVLEKELLNIQIQNGTVEASADTTTITSYLPQYCMTFVSPPKGLYKDLQLSLNGYAVSGVLVFVDNTYPGSVDAIMTEKAFQTLTGSGWRAAISVDSQINFKAEQTIVVDTLRTCLTEYKVLFEKKTGISPEMVYFDNDHYKPWMDSVLSELGFTTVINAKSSLAIGDSSFNVLPTVDYTNVSSEYVRGTYSHYQMMLMDCRSNAPVKSAYKQKYLQEVLDYLIRYTNEGKMVLEKADVFLEDSKEETQLVLKKAAEHAKALSKILEKTGLTEITEEGLTNRIEEIKEEIKQLYKQ